MGKCAVIRWVNQKVKKTAAYQFVYLPICLIALQI